MVVGKIPEVDPDAEILLLLGTDILCVHKVREQYNGPYAQCLDLGWVIVGELCLGAARKSANISVYKTNIPQYGRASTFESMQEQRSGQERLSCQTPNPSLQNTVLHDDKPAPSIEDEIFLETVEQQVYKNSSNTWVAPLPFRSPGDHHPNNRSQAIKQFSSLRRTLDQKTQMKKDFINFMQKMFDPKQAEPAPPLKEGQESWYLPLLVLTNLANLSR